MLKQLSICGGANFMASRCTNSIELKLCSVRKYVSVKNSNYPISRLQRYRATSQIHKCSHASLSSTTEGWNSKEKTDLDGLTPIDIEKTLFRIKRKMGMHHSKGIER